MSFRIFTFPILAIIAFLLACNPKGTMKNTTDNKESSLVEEEISYVSEGVTMKGYIVYDKNQKDRKPAIIVIHEWWGLTDYPKKRAKQLAELGYVAMAIDMFGNGTTAETPDEAKALASAIYQNPNLAQKRFDAAMTKLKTYSQVDSNNIAAIGYCFGGAQAITMAKLGAHLKGIVSFHGNVNVAAPAIKELLKAKMLICHGEADKFVSTDNINAFKKEMDGMGANYTIKTYANATHAFTNPDATAKGEKFQLPIAYNEAADKQSWNDMKLFFEELFKQ